MLSVSYAGKNAYSAGKTGGIWRGDASGANRCYVLAHCVVVGWSWVVYRTLLVIGYSHSKPQANQHSDLLQQNLILSLTLGIHLFVFYLCQCQCAYQMNNSNHIGPLPTTLFGISKNPLKRCVSLYNNRILTRPTHPSKQNPTQMVVIFQNWK